MPGIDKGGRFTLLELDREAHGDSFAAAVRQGLISAPKTLPCRFFYDEAGSGLFEQICELPEYYPTRTERQILKLCADDLARRFKEPVTLVELGSGSASKTRLLIEAFLKRHGTLRFMPVDISQDMLEQSSLSLLDSYPGLEIVAVAGSYQKGIEHFRGVLDRPKVILFLGLTLGNQSPSDGAGFLAILRRAMTAEDRMLLGLDRKKDMNILERAYDDEKGITAAFNLNILHRINRELGGSFRPEAFVHRALYNFEKGRVEMHLVSRADQHVEIESLEMSVPFRAGESIHTENSYKFSEEEIQVLAARAGFRIDRQWSDERSWFTETLLAPLAEAFLHGPQPRV